MNELINPYFEKDLTVKISLSSDKINENITNNIKNELIKKVEKKCLVQGYVMNINKIIDIKGGRVDTENPSCNIIYDVRFNAKICLPIIGKQIICILKESIQGLLMFESGPIECVVTRNNISSEVFNIDNEITYKVGNEKRVLEVGTYVRISIIGQKYNQNDKTILVIGYLKNIASDSDVEKFYKDLYNNSSNSLKTVFI